MNRHDVTHVGLCCNRLACAVSRNVSFIATCQLIGCHHITLSAARPSLLSDPSVVSVAHWHSARWAWNGYQPDLGSIPRPGRI